MASYRPQIFGAPGNRRIFSIAPLTIVYSIFLLAVPLKTQALTLDETVDVYMTQTPSALVAATIEYGQHSAAFTLQGVSHTEPQFTVSADLIYMQDQNPAWQISNFTHSPIPSGYSVPRISTERTYYVIHSDIVSVATSGGEHYRMSWRITGTASPGVRPVLLPRLFPHPWCGTKSGLFLKARHTPEMIEDPDDNSWGPALKDEAIERLMPPFEQALSVMSQGRVSLTHEIVEGYVDLTNDPPSECRPYSLARSLLANLGINQSNFQSHFDWLIVIPYASFWAKVAAVYPGQHCYGNWGLRVGMTNCPHCGPGGLVDWVRGAEQASDLRPRLHVLAHELGHGLNFSHIYTKHSCPSSDHLSISEERLFDYNACQRTMSQVSTTMTYSETEVYYHMMIRAALGWLSAGQVLTVTESGTYDLYSDRFDRTASDDKPLILQILLNVKGFSDYVYLVLPNRLYVDSAAANSEDKAHALNGVEMLSIHASSRLGESRMWGTPTQFSWGEYNGGRTDRTAIPLNEEVRLVWEGTDVRIKLLSLDRTPEQPHARVKIDVDVEVPKTAVEGVPVWTNPNNVYDVNDDGSVSPLDGLFVLEELSTNGSRDLTNIAGAAASGPPYYDVNADQLISTLDVLWIFDYLVSLR